MIRALKNGGLLLFPTEDPGEAMVAIVIFGLICGAIAWVFDAAGTAVRQPRRRKPTRFYRTVTPANAGGATKKAPKTETVVAPTRQQLLDQAMRDLQETLAAIDALPGDTPEDEMDREIMRAEAKYRNRLRVQEIILR